MSHTQQVLEISPPAPIVPLTSELDMGAARSAAPISIPSLLLTSASKAPAFNASAVAKKAEILYVNLRELIRRHGIEKIGFVTYTFPDNCEDAKIAQRRYHSFATSFLKRRDVQFICVPERQERGAFHYHQAAAFPFDIRTGFDFEAYRNWQLAFRSGDEPAVKKWERKYFRSANPALKKWWTDLRTAAPKYGFGRCQTIPVINGAEAISRYLASYVTTATLNRLPRDKGLRTIRYSMGRRAGHLTMSWADGNGAVFRRGLQILGMIYELDFDGLKLKFGKKFQYQMRKRIGCFGRNYDKALPLVARIPEWADWASRVKFCSRLFNHLATEEPLDMT